MSCKSGVKHRGNAHVHSRFPHSLRSAVSNGRHARHVISPQRLVLARCGIIGIYSREGSVAGDLYEGLLMLQHRGQDSAGMVTTDWDRFVEHKGNGLVRDVFKEEKVMKQLKAVGTGSTGLAHVRYPTAGSASSKEAQPFFVNSPLGIYLIHNGNLTNTAELRDMLQSSKSFFNRMLRTSSDSEVLVNVFADEIHRAHQRFVTTMPDMDPNDRKMSFVQEAGEEIMRDLHGAFSCICLVKGVGLVAFRDPNGIRPLVLGTRLTPDGPEWCIASEDCAFGPIGFKRVRDVQPGEMIIVTEDGDVVCSQCREQQLRPCIFEYIYLARPDSVLNDISVYEFQLTLGRKLARKIEERGWDIDCIVPVPDGSRPAAIELSAELNLPYREGLVKNRYVGRTFIMPDQRTRELSVKRKLNAMPAVFSGKKVLLVDDSIVRGTTMSQIVDMVRKAGAAQVYLASASPAVKYPNVYGVPNPSLATVHYMDLSHLQVVRHHGINLELCKCVDAEGRSRWQHAVACGANAVGWLQPFAPLAGVDLPSRREFVAHNLNEEQVCEVLGADGLIYQTVEELLKTGHELNPSISQFEASCFDGKYVSGGIDEQYLEVLENGGRGKQRTIAAQDQVSMNV